MEQASSQCGMRSIPDIRSILQESGGVSESDEITEYLLVKLWCDH